MAVSIPPLPDPASALVDSTGRISTGVVPVLQRARCRQSGRRRLRSRTSTRRHHNPAQQRLGHPHQGLSERSIRQRDQIQRDVHGRRRKRCAPIRRNRRLSGHWPAGGRHLSPTPHHHGIGRRGIPDITAFDFIGGDDLDSVVGNKFMTSISSIAGDGTFTVHSRTRGIPKMSFLSGILGLDAGKATSAAAQAELQAVRQVRARRVRATSTRVSSSREARLTRRSGSTRPTSRPGRRRTRCTPMRSASMGRGATRRHRAPFRPTPATSSIWTSSYRPPTAARRPAGCWRAAICSRRFRIVPRASPIRNTEAGSTGWPSRAGRAYRRLAERRRGYGALSDLYQGGANQRLGLGASVAAGKAGANNQNAYGQEMGAKGLATLGSNIGNLFTKTSLGQSIFPGFL